MFRMHLALIAVFVATWSFAADDEKKPETPSADEAAQAIFDKYVPPIVTRIAKCKSIVVYEGLPHQTFEREVLEQELKTKKTMKFGGFSFYAEPVAVKEADAAKLLALCGDVTSFEVYSGEKLCGGYHPDWCLEFKTEEGKTYHVQICLGCHEARLHGTRTSGVADLSEKAYDGFKAILPGYRKNRPEPKGGP